MNSFTRVGTDVFIPLVGDDGQGYITDSGINYIRCDKKIRMS